MEDLGTLLVTAAEAEAVAPNDAIAHTKHHNPTKQNKTKPKKKKKKNEQQKSKREKENENNCSTKLIAGTSCSCFIELARKS